MNLGEKTEARIANHARKHSSKHIEILRKEMEKGKTFEQAHTIATVKAGR